MNIILKSNPKNEGYKTLLFCMSMISHKDLFDLITKFRKNKNESNILTVTAH